MTDQLYIAGLWSGWSFAAQNVYSCFQQDTVTAYHGLTGLEVFVKVHAEAGIAAQVARRLYGCLSLKRERLVVDGCSPWSQMYWTAVLQVQKPYSRYYLRFRNRLSMAKCESTESTKMRRAHRSVFDGSDVFSENKRRWNQSSSQRMLRAVLQDDVEGISSVMGGGEVAGFGGRWQCRCWGEDTNAGKDYTSKRLPSPKTSYRSD